MAQFLAHSRCLISGGSVYTISIASNCYYLPVSLPSLSIRPVVSEDTVVPTSNPPAVLPSLGPVGTRLASPQFRSTPRTRSRAHSCGRTVDTSPRVDLWAPGTGLEVGGHRGLDCSAKGGSAAQRPRWPLTPSRGWGWEGGGEPTAGAPRPQRIDLKNQKGS